MLPESISASIGRIFNFIARYVAIGMAVYHIYTSVFGIPSAIEHRAIHLAFGLTLAFLVKPASRSNKKFFLLDIALIVAGLTSMLYIADQYIDIAYRAGTPNQWDMVLGVVSILLILEFARRVVGFQLMFVPSLFLLYLLFGHYLPGAFGHRDYTLSRIINTLFLGTDGIFGAPLGASSVYVIVFVILGAFFEKTGMGDFFIRFAYSLTGRSSSGPAQTAVVASGFFGMISGSPSSNVVTTGAFTIPLMKSVGYKAEVAGAIEAVASVGGQIMPPIMGASAFIIAELLEIPYFKIVGAAFLPAVLYYSATAMSVHLQAKKRGLKPRLKDLLNPLTVLKEGWLFTIPLVLLVFLLVVIRYSPYKCAIITIFTTIIVSMLKASTRSSFKDLVDALEISSRTALTIVSACSASGIVIGVVTLTGLGLKVSMAVMEVAKGSLVIALLITQGTAILLGMGLPTAAAYITTSILLTGVLIKLGLPPLVAHMFVFYSAIVSNLTPPVCIASFAAAGVAKSDPWRTAVTGFGFGIPGPYLVPYVFVYRQALMWMNNPGFLEVGVSFLVGLIAVLSLAVSLRGYGLVKMTLPERIAAAGASLLLIPPGQLTTSIGLSAGGAVVMVQLIRHYRSRKGS